MALLTKERLSEYGPFVDFMELLPNGQERHIVAWADDLLSVYCSITNQYLPFDPHLGGNLNNREMQKLSSDLFGWCAHLATCRLDENDVMPLINLYIKNPPIEHAAYQSALEELRCDLIQTASALAMNIIEVSGVGNTIVIDGM